MVGPLIRGMRSHVRDPNCGRGMNGSGDHRRDCSSGGRGVVAADRHIRHAGDGVRRVGVLVRPFVFDEMTGAPTGRVRGTLADATLAVALFRGCLPDQASLLRREYAVPPRRLGVGLPLTISIGAVLAAVIFDQRTGT
jgi:hypothetical protein